MAMHKKNKNSKSKNIQVDPVLRIHKLNLQNSYSEYICSKNQRKTGLKN